MNSATEDYGLIGRTEVYTEPSTTDRSDTGTPDTDAHRELAESAGLAPDDIATETPSLRRSRQTGGARSGYLDRTGYAGDEAPAPARRHSNPHARARSGLIGDLIAAGYASQGNVIVETFAQPMPPRRCRICSGPVLHPWSEWVCDIDGDVTEAPEIGNGRRCGCNWCTVAKHAQPVGRPAEVCSDRACQREDARREKADKRDRHYARERLLAVEVIRHEPHRTDKDLAAQLGIRPKRVKEARTLSESCPP